MQDQWTTAEGSEICSYCGEVQEEGWDIVVWDVKVLCEPCMDDMIMEGLGDDLTDFADDFLIDNVGFADPGGISSLRAATEDNPRNLPCPSCGEENTLTPLDIAAGYQCDACAYQDEMGF